MINNLLIKFLRFCLFVPFAVPAAYAITLQKGQVVNDATVTELASNSEAYLSIVAALQATPVYENSSLTGFIVPEAGNGEQYALLSDKTIHQTSYPANQYIGGWPLSRWSHQYASPEVVARFKELSTAYPLPFDYEATGSGVGCYGDSPIRFGDIENDAKKELVIILDKLFMVYSLDEKRLVFAEYLDASDWLTNAEKLEQISPETVIDTQFVSRLMTGNNLIAPGVRSYAKLYFGDFNNDGYSDILAWRKSYRSNAVDNAVIGFSKQSESLQHFSTVLSDSGNGEYMPQVTDMATIKSWLTSSQLTWQKGYPSQSECAGQSGLIPEMHDVLLNDADVML